MEQNIYVTCQVKPTAYVSAVTGQGTKHYAIKCEDIKQAKLIASDVSSFEGVSYVRINETGRLRHKDTILCTIDNYFEKI